MAVVTPKYRTRKKQVSVAPGHHLAFAAGHGYYDAPGASRPKPAAAPPADPYDAVIAGLPAPSSAAQIGQQAQSQISPLVAAITGNIGKQTAAATSAIKGYSTEAAHELGALNFQQPYNEAASKQAAVDAALRQSLAGEGAAGADALSSRLGVIGDPSVGAAAGALEANGAASGNTQLAQGSAALSALLANAAGAGSYGQKQPGIARLAGLQDITATSENATNQIGQQTQQVESGLPGIIQALTQQSDQRASAIASARQNQVARGDALATTDATNTTKLAVAQTSANARQAAIDAQNSRTAATIAGQDRRTQAQIDAANQRAAAKLGATKTGVKAPTANQLNGYVDAFKNGKPATVRVKQPKADSNGNAVYRTKSITTGQLTFTQAYKRLTALGVGDKQARAALDSAYKRGEQGRGWLTNEEQHKLATAKVQPRAHRYKGVAFLDPSQTAVFGGKPPARLTEQSRIPGGPGMPPGYWTQGSTSTKDLGAIYIIEETY